MKTRLWCFTNFELDFDYDEYYNSTSAEYIIFGTEVCPKTNRTHHQGFVYFSGARSSIKGVAKQLGKCHVEPCRGNLDQNCDYCEKDSNITEYGVKPKQGHRTDLDAVKDSILNGDLSVEDIVVENPCLFHQYGRTLNKLEDIALRKRFRNWMTLGEWYYGKTGTGKSHKAFEGFSPETHYVLNVQDSGWWCGYSGQEIVIINEFRGQIQFSELLDLLDKYPKTIKRRNREPVPFLAKKVIITSSMRPCDVYSNVLTSTDSIKQLERRLKVVEFSVPFENGTEVV